MSRILFAYSVLTACMAGEQAFPLTGVAMPPCWQSAWRRPYVPLPRQHVLKFNKLFFFILMLVCMQTVATAQTDLGFRWIRLVGRQGCDFSGEACGAAWCRPCSTPRRFPPFPELKARKVLLPCRLAGKHTL
jgi:hypothetical protein